jgi:hypothetical protein
VNNVDDFVWLLLTPQGCRTGPGCCPRCTEARVRRSRMMPWAIKQKRIAGFSNTPSLTLLCSAAALIATFDGDPPPCELDTALGNYRRYSKRAVQSAQATPCPTPYDFYSKRLISDPAMLLYVRARLTRNDQGTAMFGTGCGPAVRSERRENYCRLGACWLCSWNIL